MPVYEYGCARCGDFTALRPLAQFMEPCPCPHCGEPAARAFLTAPAFAGMPASSRKAHALNERAAHEPKLSSRTDGGRNHAPGCSCCSGVGKSAAVKAADGSKTFPGKRPWMISH